MSRRRVTARWLGAALATALGLGGCSTGPDAVDQQAGGDFHYVGATTSGHLIPIPDRKSAGNATAPYLRGGATFQLSSLKGKVAVLNYWATWCPPCVIETPEYDKVYRSVKATGVQFVGIDVKETNKSKAEAFVADNDISYPMVYDEIGRTALQLGRVPMAGLPATVLIDRQGRVAAVYVGPQTGADLEPVLKTLAAETG